MRLVVFLVQLTRGYEMPSSLSGSVYQLIVTIEQYECLVLVLNISSTIRYSQLLYEFSMFQLIKGLSKPVYGLYVGSNLLYNYIALSKFLLNVPETSVNMSRSSVRGCFSTICNINCQLIVLVDSNQPYIRVFQLFKQSSEVISLLCRQSKLDILGLGR